MKLVRTTGVATAMMAILATSASAKTITLHYFLKQIHVRVVNATGRPVNHKHPVAGDVGELTAVAYVGDHTHHASRWTASLHMRCVFRSSRRSTCDAQIAIGGSMLLANGFHFKRQGNFKKITINSGTGVFQRAHGTLTSVDVGSTNSSDLTIRVRL